MSTQLKKHISPHGRVTAVSMMKDEAPFLIEWFAHHLAVGFTDILVYTNDCSDGTDSMLMRLEELNLGHHRASIIPDGKKPQPAAIKQAQLDPVVQKSDWLLLLDADEFLSINLGDGKIDTMISAAGSANGIVVTWRVFGSAGVQDWSRLPVTEQYTQAAPPDWNKGWGVKTLFKFDAEYWKLGIHRPSMKSKHLNTNYPNTVHWLNGSGLPMEEYFKFRGWRSIRRTIGYDWAQMNHYAVKSIDAYAMRKLRGNVNLKEDKYNDAYWALQDRNEVHDSSVLRYSAKTAEIKAELLKDPVLNKYHNEALERLEAKLADIKKTDAYSTLKESLIKASDVPISKVSAKPPKPRNPAKIAAKMSDVEKKSLARTEMQRRSNPPAGRETEAIVNSTYMPELIDRSIDIPAKRVANHEVLLPADPRIFGPAALSDLLAGKFDRRNARHRGALLAANDRLFEVGAGISFLSILAANYYPDIVILAHEERSDLADIGRDLAKENGVNASSLTIVDGPILSSAKNKDTAKNFQSLVDNFQPTVVAIRNPLITPEVLKNTVFSDLRRIIVHSHLAEKFDYGEIMQESGFYPSSRKAGGLILDAALR